jgi:hypothetical protein
MAVPSTARVLHNSNIAAARRTVTINRCPVHTCTPSNEIEYIAPQKRVY